VRTDESALNRQAQTFLKQIRADIFPNVISDEDNWCEVISTKSAECQADLLP
jgi:hypothetical protein